MKKKGLLMAGFFFAINYIILAQNVGIGTTTPTRGKLEVVGVAGTGATVAVFGGNTTGISLQCNWPTIGFNQYRDATVPGSQGKYLANGHAAVQYFDPVNGNMVYEMFPSGNMDTYTLGPTVGMVLGKTGKLTVTNGVHLNFLEISSDKTGVGNNLLPIGMASVQSTGSKQGGTSNITTSFVTNHYVIQLNESVTGTIPVVTVQAGSNTGVRVATCINGNPTEIWVYIWTGAGVLTQAGFNIVVYKP
jgi:hypothetical protein